MSRYKETFIDSSLSVPVVVLGLVPKWVGFRQVISDVLKYLNAFESWYNNPGTPVFTHFTSARQGYAPHDVAMKNKNKI